MSTHATLSLKGLRLEVSNLDKVFYPRTGFTKGEIINYYIQISRWLLPHLKNRPLTLKRYPNGVEGEFFYEKNCPPHHPDWLKTIKVAKSGGGEINYCLINDLPSLVWAANLADLELHTFQHQAPAMDRPAAVVFDLDPGPPADLVTCCEVALKLKANLDALGLESLPKTSGSKGMQVCVPLNTPVDYEQTKSFARAMAGALQQQLPELVVSKMQKDLRRGKVLVDWSQNDAHKTTVSVYSLRAKERPTISTPITWAEVRAALNQRRILSFEPGAVLKRVEKLGDLFGPALRLKQKLPRLEPGGSLVHPADARQEKRARVNRKWQKQPAG